MTHSGIERRSAPAVPGEEPRHRAHFVWAVWAVMLGSVLAAIALDGRNIPFEEDWLMVAAMTGHEPDVPGWLWSQNSEHRLPLPRLVNLLLLRATGDFRAAMVFDTLTLGAVAAGMILAARGLRGRASATDAFFPLVLLHLGHWDNLVWGWQIQFVLPTVLAGALLLVVVGHPTLATPGAALAGALALVSLPLSGANGLVLAPPLAGWFAYRAWLGRREADASRRLTVWLPAGAASLTLLLCAAYFVGYASSPWNAPSPGPAVTLATAGKFVAFSLGPAAAKSWLLFGIVASLILGASLPGLLAARRDRHDERLRAVGLLAFLAAALLLALAVGWGRAGRAAETGRMPTRYVLLAAPGLCAAYFALLRYGPEHRRRLAPAALALLMALLLPLNSLVGLDRRKWFGAGFSAFEQDLVAGASAEALARRHHPFMLHWDEPLMVTSLRRLHRAGIGPFADWEPDPPGAAGATAP